MIVGNPVGNVRFWPVGNLKTGMLPTMKVELPESPPVEYFEGGKLSEAKIAGLEPAERIYKLSDGHGLFIEVMPAGAKRWRLAYRFDGKQKKISMGIWPKVSLPAARINTARAKALIRDGRDPSEARQLATAAEKRERAQVRAKQQNRVRAVVDEWLAKSAPGWSAATLHQTRGRLENDVLPFIGETPIDELTAPVVLRNVQRIVDRGAIETARRVLRLIRQICAYAVITGKLDTNPAADLSAALPSVRAKHMPAIVAPEKVGALLRAIDGYEGEAAVRAALQLAPLVFVRPGELRCARWDEIDLDAARWEIPGDRMKMGEPLLVPLSRQAVDILREMDPLTGSGALVFTCTRTTGRPISNNTLNAALRRLGYSKDEMTAHGFRAMARTLIEEELDVRPDLIEMQLGHRVRDPNGRAYNRTKHLPARAEMMQRWADYLDQLRAAA